MPQPKSFAILVSLLFFTPLAALGQTPLKVKLCDLVREPEKYTRQWVEVTGTVDLAFEDFSLRTGDCGEKHRGIWLAYGGDEPTPTTSSVNDRARKPGTVLKVEGIPVPLQRNTALQLFLDRLSAQRQRTPDGFHCDKSCRLYDVTATFVGLFMAAPEDLPNTLSGYGHFGCCHLLAIRRVVAVDAKRTEVPAGGRFTCSQETWEMDQAQETDFLKGNSCIDTEECGKVDRRQFGLIAEHWNDKIKIDHQSTTESYDSKPGTTLWRSTDLLTSYSWEDPEDLHRNVTATRTVCTPVEAPYSSQTPVRCTTLVSGLKPWDKPQKTSSKSSRNETWAGALEVVSRYALEEVARRLNIALMPGLALKECDKPYGLEDVQYTWCEWSEPSGMQSFDIQLTRAEHSLSEGEMDKVPWGLHDWDGTTCVAGDR